MKTSAYDMFRVARAINRWFRAHGARHSFAMALSDAHCDNRANFIKTYMLITTRVFFILLAMPLFCSGATQAQSYPTQSGVSMEVIVWHAIFAPAATPKPVLARLHAELSKVLNNAEVRKRLDEQGVDARPSTPDELAAFARAETGRGRHAVKAAGAAVN